MAGRVSDGPAYRVAGGHSGGRDRRAGVLAGRHDADGIVDGRISKRALKNNLLLY